MFLLQDIWSVTVTSRVTTFLRQEMSPGFEGGCGRSSSFFISHSLSQGVSPKKRFTAYMAPGYFYADREESLKVKVVEELVERG